MRWISKPALPPLAISTYLTAQTPVEHGLDYSTFASSGMPQGGSWGGQLRRELTVEQCGLCAYTGAGIDERVGKLADPNGKLKFSGHNEHLKPQSVCRAELIAAGGTPGVTLGKDMDHRNIVAALLVSGSSKKISKSELFGAAHRENDPVPVVPTNSTCEQRFAFDAGGGVSATDPADQSAVDTITVLNLNHETLRGWREQAIGAFVEGIANRADAEEIVAKTTIPTNGWLPEYCFAIRQVVQSLLDTVA